MPVATKLPYFASNGAIIVEKIDRDRFRVACPGVTVVVDLDTWDEHGWSVDPPGNWLHTDEEGERVANEARNAMDEYLFRTPHPATPNRGPIILANCDNPPDPEGAALRALARGREEENKKAAFWAKIAKQGS